MGIETLFSPVYDEQPPEVDESLFGEVDTVRLADLDENEVVFFEGNHPASKYAVRVLGAKDLGNQRPVRIWYLGSGEVNAFGGLACFMGPGKGALETQAKNLLSLKSIDEGLEGVMSLEHSYRLPLFHWDEEGKIFADWSSGSRMEGYTKIRVKKEGAIPLIERVWTKLSEKGFALAHELDKEDKPELNLYLVFNEKNERIGYIINSLRGFVKVYFWEPQHYLRFIKAAKETGLCTEITNRINPDCADSYGIWINTDGKTKYKYRY